MSILFSQIQTFISKKKEKKYFANCRLLIRFVMFCFKNYAKPPLRKNQEERKKQNSNDDMKTTEARLHADAGQ